MPKEDLRVSIIIEQNGEEIAGSGFDYSSIINDGRELRPEYVLDTLSDLCMGTVRCLQKKELVCPFKE